MVVGGSVVKTGVYWDVRESVYMWSSLMIASTDAGLNWQIFLQKVKHVCWADQQHVARGGARAAEKKAEL